MQVHAVTSAQRSPVRAVTVLVAIIHLMVFDEIVFLVIQFDCVLHCTQIMLVGILYYQPGYHTLSKGQRLVIIPAPAFCVLLESEIDVVITRALVYIITKPREVAVRLSQFLSIRATISCHHFHAGDYTFLRHNGAASHEWQDTPYKEEQEDVI